MTSETPKAPEWRAVLCELQVLQDKLAQSIDRMKAIQELPAVEAGDQTLDSFLGLAELTRVKELAECLAQVAASFGERHQGYSLNQLCEVIARMINTPESRRSYTYVPPYDIEKTLRAFMRLRDEAKGEIRILEDPVDKVA